jgi:CBS-domain-containing membrane protein
MPLSEIKPHSVRSCRSDDSLQRVAEIMWSHDCDYVLIVDTNGRPTGMVTDVELFAAARKQDQPLAHIRVSSIASSRAFATGTTQLLRIVGQSKTRRLAHQIPILDNEGSLVNIVTEDWLAGCTRRFRVQKTLGARRSLNRTASVR